MTDYRIAGIDGLQMHHLYRAIAWLGEEISPAAAGCLAPRCVKDVIEERLFECRRDLFSDLSLVFMDSTSFSFYAAGSASLGAYGHSKDYRADLKQMILAVVSGRRRSADLHRAAAGKPPMPPCCCRFSTVCASAFISAGCASSPTAA